MAFDINQFKNIRSFSGRKKYAEQHLQQIGRGSSRVVYDLGDGKVLKLAYNPKGLAQNETEAGLMNDNISIIAKVFDADEDGLWVIMEKAEKMKPSQFKQFFGYNVHTVDMFLNNYHALSKGRDKRHTWSLPEKTNEDLWENEYISDITQLSEWYDIVPTDFGRLANWGVVERDGTKVPVVVDYGFDSNTASTLYKMKLEHVKKKFMEEGKGMKLKDWFSKKWRNKVNFQE